MTLNWYNMDDKFYAPLSYHNGYNPTIYIYEYEYADVRLVHNAITEQYFKCEEGEYTGSGKDKEVCNKIINDTPKERIIKDLFVCMERK